MLTHAAFHFLPRSGSAILLLQRPTSNTMAELDGNYWSGAQRAEAEVMIEKLLSDDLDVRMKAQREFADIAADRPDLVDAVCEQLRHERWTLAARTLRVAFSSNPSLGSNIDSGISRYLLDFKPAVTESSPLLRIDFACCQPDRFAAIFSEALNSNDSKSVLFGLSFMFRVSREHIPVDKIFEITSSRSTFLFLFVKATRLLLKNEIISQPDARFMTAVREGNLDLGVEGARVIFEYDLDGKDLAVDILLKALSSEDWIEQCCAMDVVESTKYRSSKIDARLMTLTKHPNEEVQEQAITIIREASL
jgi:hypothetical protein